MKLRNVWAAPDLSIRAHDSSRNEFVVADVVGGSRQSAKEFQREIVIAVNCHDELVQALKDCLYIMHSPNVPSSARAALAKATGGDMASALDGYQRTEDEKGLAEMMRDPRYWRDRDPEFVAEVTSRYRRVIDGEASS